MIDYTCLGQNTKIRERRYDVLSLLVKGTKPREIVDTLKLTDDQVKNDIAFLTTKPLHNMPVEIAKDFNLSFYELKVMELEDKLDELKDTPKFWMAIQELIRKYKVDSLKLQGLMNDKVEHSGDVTIRYVGDAIDGDSNPIPPITSTTNVPQTQNKV